MRTVEPTSSGLERSDGAPSDQSAANSSGKTEEEVLDDLDDGRHAWDWKTRYPIDAHDLINFEAKIVACYLVVFLLITLAIAGFVEQTITVNFTNEHTFTLHVKLLAIFFTGALGGTTFSVKWLMHSVAKGMWHQDRFFWRVFVPVIGGVYAVIVMNLFSGGLLGNGGGAGQQPLSTVCALSFLVGYFSDGVSGLLTNVANAVFGTVEKK